MDILRLLSRSTNLKISSRNTTEVLPSSGATANPQLFGISKDIEKPNGPSSNKKRKRVNTPADISGSGHDTNSSAPSNVANQRIQEDGVESKQKRKKIADEYQEESPLAEEECRRILGAHKLNITLLSPARDGGLGASSSVRSSKTEDAKKKKKKASKPESLLQAKKTQQRLFPQPLTSFGQLRGRYAISRRLAENIRAQGFKMPTEVQLGSLPILLDPEDRFLDLLTVAPTGSGKTLAFLIPLLNGILRDRKERNANSDAETQGIKAIVVVPTKELANQIVNEARKLAIGLKIKISGMRKGMNLFADTESHENLNSDSDSDASNESGPRAKKSRSTVVKSDVLVSTPLVLLNAIEQGKRASAAISQAVSSVRYLVLDEADVLLDLLFRPQTLGIWSACTNPHLRVSLWSATMGSSIEALAQSTIQSRRDSIGITDSTKLIRLVVGLKDSAIPNISHRLVYAATEQGKLLALRQLLHPTSSLHDSGPSLRPPFLVFTQTIPRAIALHSELKYDISPEAGGSTRIAVLHSDLSDKIRDGVMTRFRKGEIWILITTDLLSRGVDFRGINGVVNYDIPSSSAAYIHRVGRTGRAGRDGGVAVTFYTKEDVPFVKNVANVIAASEKLRQNPGTAATASLQKWLIAALPTPSKNEKKRLKLRGVEERRTPAEGAGSKSAKLAAKTRISTKSGYERRLENNRRGALQASQKKAALEDQEDDVEVDILNDENDEWDGFD
ncbi:MAG: RNA-dependent ATPase rok1 [Trizodia sp. TS-e1964]|nr:MAG: RNA-dependent ATPase rok1 [Trizodia sp. TS-e1964]